MKTNNNSRDEWLRLKSLYQSSTIAHTHRPTLSSKRSARNNGKGVGQVLRRSRVTPQVNMEKVFVNHK